MCSDDDDICGVCGEQFVRFGMFVGYGGQACGTQGIWMGFVIFVHSSFEGLKELAAFWKCPDPHWSSWWGKILCQQAALVPHSPIPGNLLPWDYK